LDSDGDGRISLDEFSQVNWDLGSVGIGSLEEEGGSLEEEGGSLGEEGRGSLEEEEGGSLEDGGGT